jgi:dTDP-4-amino-4,6-dideoxygalactose transaminase
MGPQNNLAELPAVVAERLRLPPRYHKILGSNPGRQVHPASNGEQLNFNRGQPLLDVAESQIGLRNRLRSACGWQVKICVIPLTRFVQLGCIWDKLAC